MLEMAGLAGILMLSGCIIPSHMLPKKMPHDSLLHALAFALLTLPLCSLLLSPLELLVACVGLWLFGLAIECLQQLVPGRQFGLDDVAYNTIGIVVVAIPYALLAYN